KKGTFRYTGGALHGEVTFGTGNLSSGTTSLVLDSANTSTGSFRFTSTFGGFTLIGNVLNAAQTITVDTHGSAESLAGLTNRGTIVHNGSQLKIYGPIVNEPSGIVRVGGNLADTHYLVGQPGSSQYLLNQGGVVQIDAPTSLSSSAYAFRQTSGTWNV